MEKPNIILIVVDCLRKDYAYTLERELLKRGFILYDNVIATASWTLPSVTSILTGLYPSAHNVHETSEKKIPNIRVAPKIAKILLSTRLLRAGYITYLISANPLVSPELGFKGFIYADNIDPISQLRFKLKTKVISKIIETYRKREIRNVLKYINDFLTNNVLLREKEDKGAEILLLRAKKILRTSYKPRFIYMHFMELHEPYNTINPEELFTWQYINIITGLVNKYVIEALKSGYEKSLHYVSKKIVSFIDWLEENSYNKNSLIIVTADHGQMLGEHNIVMHGNHLYDELLKVPLLIRYPNNSNVIVFDDNNEYYISLRKVKDLILGFITNNLKSDRVLYEEVVYAENYGVSQDLENFAKVYKVPVRIEELTKHYDRTKVLEKHKVAIYYGRGKAIYNINDKRVEYVDGLLEEKDIIHLARNFIREALRQKVNTLVSYAS